MTRNAWIPFIVLIILLLTAPVGQARPTGDILYVQPSATGSGSCNSWANACTLQTALGHAGPGDEIWVAEGTHKPASGTEGGATLELVSGVAVYGGLQERDGCFHLASNRVP